MQGTCLRFYLGEKQRHHGVLLWEWLLERANVLGLRGGCAFRAIGGFGHHHALHEDRFFELAGSCGVVVEFIAKDADIDRLHALIVQEKVRLFCTRFAVQFTVINPDADDSLDTSSG